MKLIKFMAIRVLKSLRILDKERIYNMELDYIKKVMDE